MTKQTPQIHDKAYMRRTGKVLGSHCSHLICYQKAKIRNHRLYKYNHTNQFRLFRVRIGSQEKMMEMRIILNSTITMSKIVIAMVLVISHSIVLIISIYFNSVDTLILIMFFLLNFYYYTLLIKFHKLSIEFWY